MTVDLTGMTEAAAAMFSADCTITAPADPGADLYDSDGALLDTPQGAERWRGRLSAAPQRNIGRSEGDDRTEAERQQVRYDVVLPLNATGRPGDLLTVTATDHPHNPMLGRVLRLDTEPHTASLPVVQHVVAELVP